VVANHDYFVDFVLEGDERAWLSSLASFIDDQLLEFGSDLVDFLDGARRQSARIDVVLIHHIQFDSVLVFRREFAIFTFFFHFVYSLFNDVFECDILHCFVDDPFTGFPYSQDFCFYGVALPVCKAG